MPPGRKPTKKAAPKPTMRDNRPPAPKLPSRPEAYARGLRALPEVKRQVTATPLMGGVKLHIVRAEPPRMAYDDKTISKAPGAKNKPMGRPQQAGGSSSYALRKLGPRADGKPWATNKPMGRPDSQRRPYKPPISDDDIFFDIFGTKKPKPKTKPKPKSPKTSTPRVKRK
jgi:hypothetical protein